MLVRVVIEAETPHILLFHTSGPASDVVIFSPPGRNRWPRRGTRPRNRRRRSPRRRRRRRRLRRTRPSAVLRWSAATGTISSWSTVPALILPVSVGSGLDINRRY